MTVAMGASGEGQLPASEPLVLIARDNGSKPSMETKEKVYITEEGMELRLKHVSSNLLTQITRAIEFPKPPTYKVELASGDVEEYDHDETTLEVEDDEEATRQNKRAWEKYKKELDEANADAMRLQTRAMLFKGIDIELPEETDWIEELEILGVDIPDNKTDLKILYIETEVLKSLRDMLEVTVELMKLSGVRGEAIDKIESSFRSLLEGPEGPGVDGEPSE